MPYSEKIVYTPNLRSTYDNEVSVSADFSIYYDSPRYMSLEPSVSEVTITLENEQRIAGDRVTIRNGAATWYGSAPDYSGNNLRIEDDGGGKLVDLHAGEQETFIFTGTAWVLAREHRLWVHWIPGAEGMPVSGASAGTYIGATNGRRISTMRFDTNATSNIAQYIDYHFFVPRMFIPNISTQWYARVHWIPTSTVGANTSTRIWLDGAVIMDGESPDFAISPSDYVDDTIVGQNIYHITPWLGEFQRGINSPLLDTGTAMHLMLRRYTGAANGNSYTGYYCIVGIEIEAYDFIGGM